MRIKSNTNSRKAAKLQNRVALITGGDSGIGRAVAALFAREGADVALVFLDEEQSDAQQCQTDVENEGRQALLIPGDVQDAEFCEEAIRQAVVKYDRIDVLEDPYPEQST